MNRNHLFLITVLFTLFLAISCVGAKIKNEDINLITEDGIMPIDIRSPKFWQLQPWKNGTLITTDIRGRFSEISFDGVNKMKLRRIVNSRYYSDTASLTTWPEAGVIVNRLAGTFNLAAIDDGVTKSWQPESPVWALRGYYINIPVLLDPEEGLIGFSCVYREDSTRSKLYVYNYKKDLTIYETPTLFSIYLYMTMDEQYAIGRTRNKDGSRKWGDKIIFYNWRTGDILENDLTRILNRNNFDFYVRPHKNINVEKRYLFGRIRPEGTGWGEEVMVTWNEEYSDVKIFLLSNFEPEKIIASDPVDISPDGKWGSLFTYGWKQDGETLYKRAFFHLDEKYSGGISRPIYAGYYYESSFPYGAFVDHPVHGICFAEGVQNNAANKGKPYLSLYRMSDALSEIDRQLEPPVAAGMYLDRGIQFASSGDYSMAIREFTEAIKIDGSLARAYTLRAKALFAMSANIISLGEKYSSFDDVSRPLLDYTLKRRAIADFEHAIRLDPNSAEAYLERGILYYNNREYDRAIADTNRAIQLSPNFAQAYNSRGNDYRHRGDYDSAIADYNKAISINPNYARAYMNRGSVYMDKGDFTRAIADYTQAIQLDPNDAVIYNNRGFVYYTLGDYDRSIIDYTHAINLDPNNYVVYFNRGIAYFGKEDYDHSIADYEAVMRLDSANRRIVYFLSNAERRQNLKQ